MQSPELLSLHWDWLGCINGHICQLIDQAFKSLRCGINLSESCHVRLVMISIVTIGHTDDDSPLMSADMYGPYPFSNQIRPGIEMLSPDFVPVTEAGKMSRSPAILRLI